MTVYLDVSALRIQKYLVRYPRLRSITAASAMLADETRTSAVDAVIDSRAQPNPAAGEADGKVSLVVNDGQDVELLARDLVAHLMARLPAARFEALWAEADSYAESLILMNERRGSSSDIVTAPRLAEFPAERLCQRCGASAAISEVQGIDGSEWSCWDCAWRVPDVKTGTDRRTGPILSGYPVPRDFDELASLGIDAKRNHLATVYADGNALGRFFKHAVDTLSADQLNALSRAVTDATRESLRRAAEQVQPDGTKTGVVVKHVVGGDDVLVSLPASFAWEFTITYLSAFSELMREKIKDLGTELQAPSASGAIVFSHKSHPFSTVFQLADEALKTAKSFAAGTEATVAWLDVTADGDTLPAYRRPVAIAELEQSRSEISELAKAPASALKNVDGYLAKPNPYVAAAHVRKLQRRLRVPGLDRFIYGPLSKMPEIPTEPPTGDAALEAQQQIDMLRNWISLSRWWNR